MRQQNLRRFAWTAFLITLLTIVWGGWVRASGSGAGCGENWPLCGQSGIPDTAHGAAWIEFSHRLVSGICFLSVLALFYFFSKNFPKQHPARLSASLSLLFIVVEVLIGASLVLFGLVDRNASPVHTAVVALHLINSMFLLSSLVFAAHTASFENTPTRRRDKLIIPLIFGLIGVLLVSASGAVSALSITLFPSDTLAESLLKELSEEAHMLIRLRSLHIVLGALLGVCAWFFGAKFIREKNLPKGIKDGLLIVCSLVLLQVVVGVGTLWLLAPLHLQMLHLFLGAVIWSLLTYITAQVFYG